MTPADPYGLARPAPVSPRREPVWSSNRAHEARADVLTYTTPPLPEVIEAIGAVRVELFVRASPPHLDLFARVCDVDPDGASWNVCDALARGARPCRSLARRQHARGLRAVADRTPLRSRQPRSPAGSRRHLALRATRAPARTSPPPPSCKRWMLQCSYYAHPSVLVLPAAGARTAG